MNILVCGRMKQGKTTLAIYLAKQWAFGVVVWDPRNMIETVPENVVHDPDELEDAIKEKRWRNGLIVYRPLSLEPGDEFAAMCEMLFTPADRFEHFAIVVDEASQMQSSHSIQPYLSLAVRQHPRSALIVQTTHSLQDWHRASKDMMSRLYCFRLQGRSLEAVVDYCDASDELRETIRTLPLHHYVEISFEDSAQQMEFSLHKPLSEDAIVLKGNDFFKALDEEERMNEWYV